MPHMKKGIDSEWVMLKGIWNPDARAYTRVIEEPRMKQIAMELFERAEITILKFAGPTGHESYYVDKYLAGELLTRDQDNFCICAGTINSWPRCTVKRKDVADFLIEYQKEIEKEKPLEINALQFAKILIA